MEPKTEFLPYGVLLRMYGNGMRLVVFQDYKIGDKHKRNYKFTTYHLTGSRGNLIFVLEIPTPGNSGRLR